MLTSLASSPPWWERKPSGGARVGCALLLGAVAVIAFAANNRWGPGYVRGTAADLGGALEGGRRILAGQHNIYAVPYAPYVTAYPLSYPLTTAFLVLPLSLFAPTVAAMIFVGVSTAAAAYVLSRHRLDELVLFASAPAVFAWCWAQWSPLFLIQGIVSWTVVLGIAKPQLGAAMFAYRPNWAGLVLAVAACLATLLWSPAWPLDWLRGSLSDPTEVREHLGALFAPGGFTLLIAAWKWRDPRARMLLALAIIPNRLRFYDQLGLGLVPETTRRRVIWVASTWLAAGVWEVARMRTGDDADFVLRLVVIFLVYWPAVAFVLKPATSPAEPAA